MDPVGMSLNLSGTKQSGQVLSRTRNGVCVCTGKDKDYQTKEGAITGTELTELRPPHTTTVARHTVCSKHPYARHQDCWSDGSGSQKSEAPVTKKVSVCIASYNGAQFIGETIKSVLGSVYRDIEIIINDDASTDGTIDVIKSFHDGRINPYQNAQNLGAVANRNRVVTRATGDYVSLLNHDDLYGPLWLAFAVYQLEKNPHVGWVATAHRIIDAAGRSLRVISRFPVTGEIPRTEAFLEIAKLNGLGPGFVVRREILEEMGYYDVDAGPQADNDFFLRLASRHALYYSSSYTNASARLHANNLAHRWSHAEQVLQGARTLDKAFSDPSLSEELRGYRAMCLNNFLSKAAVQAERTIATGT